MKGDGYEKGIICFGGRGRYAAACLRAGHTGWPLEARPHTNAQGEPAGSNRAGGGFGSVDPRRNRSPGASRIESKPPNSKRPESKRWKSDGAGTATNQSQTKSSEPRYLSR